MHRRDAASWPVRYAPRSLLGSREGTDDGDATAARNGSASVARNGKFGLAFAVRVSETEPNPDWLRTGINASLNRARTQRDVERRERSASTASLRASSPRPTSWRRAPRCLIRLQPIWSPFRALVFGRLAAAEVHVPDEYRALARLTTGNIRRDSRRAHIAGNGFVATALR